MLVPTPTCRTSRMIFRCRQELAAPVFYLAAQQPCQRMKDCDVVVEVAVLRVL